MELAKVWPLDFGVMGVCPTDNATQELVPGTPGFMDLEDAVKAEKEGRVQLMAGKGWGELKEPKTERPKPKVEPKPEPAPEPAPKAEEPAPEPEKYITADLKPEDNEGDYKTREMKPKRRPGRPPKNPE